MQHEPTEVIEIERLGGLAGFGGPLARLRSVLRLDLSQLAPAQRQALEALLDGSWGAQAGASHPDGFRYRLSRTLPGHAQPLSVEVPERAVPAFVRDGMRDELT